MPHYLCVCAATLATRISGLSRVALLGLTVLGPARIAQAQTDPCALLTTAEVQKALPGSKAGRVERGLEKDGISAACDSPDGLFLIAGQDSEGDTPTEEAEIWALSVVNPARADALRPGAIRNVAGVGDAAVALVERRDEAKGIVQDVAVLVVRRGKRQVAIMAPALARRDRSEALRVPGELGKAIARRLS